MRLYTEEYQLQENEYLLKVRPCDPRYPTPKTGFLTKLTQKGALPKAFIDWGTSWDFYKNRMTPMPPIQIHTETLRQGWKLSSWRFGKSQNWASIITPEGWTIEVYLSHFLDIIQEHTVINGEIQGKFMWRDNKLVKE
jgi:hypothetical protein